MEYSSEDMLFALASMGVHVKQTNVPTHRLHRKLTQALGRSQGIPNILKKDLDERVTPSNRVENDESSITSRLVDPSTLKPWASVSNTPLEEVSKDTNPVEALARSMAEKLNVTPQGKDVNGTSADPFPLFTNEFNDLRQSVLAIAMRYDRGIKIGMLEDESKMYRIVFRVHEVYTLTPQVPLYLLSYAPQTGPLSPAMRLFIQKASPSESHLAETYGDTKPDVISMSRIIATMQEQKLWFNVLGENQKHLNDQFVKSNTPKAYIRDTSANGSGTSTPLSPPQNKRTTSNKKRSKKATFPPPTIPSSTTLEELESLLNFKISFFLPPAPLSQEDIGDLTLPGCETCGEKASSSCSSCATARYCSKQCQAEHWPSHKHICRALSKGTWITLRFNSMNGNGMYTTVINRYSTIRGIQDKTDKTPDNDESHTKPPLNTHDNKPFVIKIQRGMNGMVPMLVYDRKREFQVTISRNGQPSSPTTTNDPSGDDSNEEYAVAYDKLDSEIQVNGFMGAKIYRFAKRISDWEISVCLDRGPVGVQW